MSNVEFNFGAQFHPSSPFQKFRSREHLSVRGFVAKTIMRTTVRQVPVVVSFPDGARWGSGTSGAPELVVHRPKSLFARLGRQTKIGLGEGYMAGDWSAGLTTDLADLLTPFAERLTSLVPAWLQRFRTIVDQQLPHHQRNTLTGSRANIQAHYDLSNELFESFLDPTMSYSSAWFDPADLTLEQAQYRKIDGILDAAGVTAGTRLLEIGSGWGALAIRAAERGAQVLTITLSEEQAALARDRIRKRGLGAAVEVRIQDYREVTGEFDAIVSVEMIEAVGEEYWTQYFTKIDSLLAPGGRVAIQSILMAHHRMLATRRSYGWIQKYIFPGGLIPSLEAINGILKNATNLRIDGQQSLGPDYAQTLYLWRQQFNQQWNRIEHSGFDETFRRAWEFYLAYCEAGFRTGYLDVQQLAMCRKTATT